jgi:hypothetical protein
MASAFPTTWWYVNGQRVKCQPRLAAVSNDVVERDQHRGVARVYPAISIGASAQGGSPQTPDDKQSASYTVSPILSGRRRQVGAPTSGNSGNYVLGDPPPPSPAISACGLG